MILLSIIHLSLKKWKIKESMLVEFKIQNNGTGDILQFLEGFDSNCPIAENRINLCLGFSHLGRALHDITV